MLESLTIYSKGGLILYQYVSSPSLVGADDAVSNTRQAINSIQSRVNTNNPATSATSNFHISNGMSFVWNNAAENSFVVMALYPDILFEGPRQYLRSWAEGLVDRTTKAYATYYQEQQEKHEKESENIENNNNNNSIGFLRPDPAGFDATFRQLLQQSKTQKPADTTTKTAANTKASTATTTTTSGSNRSGKEQRHWIGEAKVSDKTMAELDQSNDKNKNTDDDDGNNNKARLLQEARQQYLPTAEEVASAADNATGGGGSSSNNANVSSSSSSSGTCWGSTMTNLWQSVVPAGANTNRVLTASDLQVPLEKLQQLLVEKNVAQSIAKNLCATVEKELVGKRLNSFYRVQTAVQQGLEKAIRNVLEGEHNNKQQVDLLRQVLTHKETTGWLAGVGVGGSSQKKKPPYVICVLGINGIGKTTSLAKLAYYFQSHNCTPLLVAADTFRSGAVEQLKTHASCLECDIFAQGYSKDPAAVAAAALQYATTNTSTTNNSKQYDVVLIDTAGRMQNNAPLMNALSKLVQTVHMDCILLVCEALVGHDALSQFQMFQKAVTNGSNNQRGIDGLLLTKFDTVGDKVGAALSLTQETGTPIVFLGTGQKYHHLQKLNVPSVIHSLFT